MRLRNTENGLSHLPGQTRETHGFQKLWRDSKFNSVQLVNSETQSIKRTQHGAKTQQQLCVGTHRIQASPTQTFELKALRNSEDKVFNQVVMQVKSETRSRIIFMQIMRKSITY